MHNKFVQMRMPIPIQLTVPVFVGVRDEIDIRVGQEFDYHQYFRAFDNTDGDISDRIEFICEAEDFSFVGLYDYECRVTDSHELTTIYQGKIFVGDISNTNYVLTSEEIDTLNLYDYYSYDVLENDDYDMIEKKKKDYTLLIIWLVILFFLTFNTIEKLLIYILSLFIQ